MVVIMYNVKITQFYFAFFILFYFIVFWESVLSLLETVFCEQRVPSPFTSFGQLTETQWSIIDLELHTYICAQTLS